MTELTGLDSRPESAWGSVWRRAPRPLDRATKHAESVSAASRMVSPVRSRPYRIYVLSLRPTNVGGARSTILEFRRSLQHPEMT